MRKFLAAAILLVAVSTPAVAATPSIFGSTETRNSTIRAFRKWVDMLARNVQPADQSPAAGGPLAQSGQCRPDSPVGCARPDWQALVKNLRGLSRREQLRAANSELNKVRYITDIENWGLPDYWATIGQFLIRDGDCEDYAIAKYMTLKALGFPPADMRILIVQDLNLGVPHAVLAVRFEGQWLILDNQIREVMPDKAIVHYRPIYSINEQFWWLHQPKQ